MSINKELIARTVFRRAEAVCFDVDSTVTEDEAIDELARFADKEKEVSDL
jgi:phosphoserine phosphatase